MVSPRHAEDLAQLKEDLKLTPPASWLAFRNLCRDWRLDHAEGVELLQLSQLYIIGSWSFDHEMYLSPGQLERLSYLLAIDHELKRLSADPLVVMRWLQVDRKTGVMQNEAPYAAMCLADSRKLGLIVLELMSAKTLLDLF